MNSTVGLPRPFAARSLTVFSDCYCVISGVSKTAVIAMVFSLRWFGLNVHSRTSSATLLVAYSISCVCPDRRFWRSRTGLRTALDGWTVGP